MYDRMGRLIHTPKGAQCEANESADPDQSKDQLYGRRPLTKVQQEVGKLLRDHKHIAQEIRLLRESIADKRRKASLARLDKIKSELEMHLVREEKLLEIMARAK